MTPHSTDSRRVRLLAPLAGGWKLYGSPRALRTAWPWFALRARLVGGDLQRLFGYSLAQRLMKQQNAKSKAHANGAQPPEETHKHPRVQRFLLVRHGQSTFNVEGRLPSQLPDVSLTDEGRQQAHQAAVALAGLNLSAVVSSPLERALETAQIIARGWAIEVRQDPRLMDTEMRPWAGRKISDVSKEDPAWLKFVQNPAQAPEGVESFEQVRERVVAVIEELRADPTAGDDVVVVAHADVIKLIIAHYTGISLLGARFIVVSNASISALSFMEGHPPALVAANWTMAPHWLVSRAKPAQQTGADGTQPSANAEEPETGAPSGVIM